MRRVEDTRVIDTLLRHPAFADRAVLEKALSGRFFAPFVHQEVVNGQRFEARARLSRAALAGIPAETVRGAAEEACAHLLGPRRVPSLLDDVRRTVARATVRIALGDDLLDSVAHAAVADIDRGIKMIGRPGMPVRRALRAALEGVLDAPERWPEGSYLGVAREQALALDLGERVDHVASVFLATGTIQVTDVVTHALIALAQTPAARGATDEEVVTEAVRCWPVNSSITRQATADVIIDGRRFRRSEPVTVVPAALPRDGTFDPGRTDGAAGWAFGVGPRACPARRVAPMLAAAVLGRYRALGVTIEEGYAHDRSLARDVAARLGPGPAPPRTSFARRARSGVVFAGVCAESYPLAFLDGLTELRRVITERA